MLGRFLCIYEYIGRFFLDDGAVTRIYIYMYVYTYIYRFFLDNGSVTYAWESYPGYIALGTLVLTLLALLVQEYKY